MGKNLIGISGKIGSGKDTIAGIVNSLIVVAEGKNWGHSVEQIIDYYQKTGMWMYNDAPINRYKVKKFADKLKDMVCMITGCTREQLEDQEFKNSELPPQWRYIMQWTGSEMQRQTSPEGWPEDRVQKYTYRSLLQYMGTELFRTQLHENVWVNALFADYKEQYTSGHTLVDPKTFGDEENFDKAFPRWIITDCRFPNEAKAIKERNGILIRVNRAAKLITRTGIAVTKTEDNRWVIDEHAWVNVKLPEHLYGKVLETESFSWVEQPTLSTHPSETALDKHKFDYVIDNDGTLEDLTHAVREILMKENII